MKHFYLLIPLLLGCSNIPTKPETSKVVVMYNKKLLNNGDVVYMNKPITIQILFSTGQSHGLHPKIYKIGGIYYDFTQRSIKEHHPEHLKLNISYEWVVQLKSKEADILFMFQNRHKIGDVKLIHFKQIKL